MLEPGEEAVVIIWAAVMDDGGLAQGGTSGVQTLFGDRLGIAAWLCGIHSKVWE